MSTDTELRKPDPPTGPVAAVEAREVVKEFGTGSTQVTALDKVSVRFDADGFSAIMGPSGSGKSTLLHCLCGLEPVTSGEILVGSTALSSMSEAELTTLRRDRIGFVFQSFNLVPVLTARENILVPLLLAKRKPENDWFDRVIDTLDLRDRLHHRPSELSGGQQQRVAVARSLMNKPDIVFADEPTGNLDSGSGQEVLGFLRRAVDEFDQTVVMVTHDPIAAAQADRIVFLEDGRIVDEMEEPTYQRILDRMRRFGG